MILGLHDARNIAEDVVRLSQGDCEVCTHPIGEKYCAAAQVLPRKSRHGLSIDVHYQVICADCHAAIKSVIEERTETGT